MYKRAALRLREPLFGDATYTSGAVGGGEQRAEATAELRRMREAFDELTQHHADLAEELLRRAQEKKPQPKKRKSKVQLHR